MSNGHRRAQTSRRERREEPFIVECGLLYSILLEVISRIGYVGVTSTPIAANHLR